MTDFSRHNAMEFHLFFVGIKSKKKRKKASFFSEKSDKYAYTAYILRTR